MTTRRITWALLAALALGLAACGNQDEGGAGTDAGPSRATMTGLRIVWAKWAPADYLTILARDYQSETGTPVTVEQIPWDQFQTTVFRVLDARQDAYDIIIGDSQWLGRGAERGHYVDLTDWMKVELDTSSFLPAALTGYSEYPRGSGKYWAVPCESDAIGWVYRKDLFEDPREKAAFRMRYRRDLAVPTT